MIHFGAAYYPEHWPEQRWPTDARLMREAGFTVARLGEFAWSRMEPQSDCFDFDWLDRVISILSREGIRIILGTPTAGPPAWLVNAHGGQPDCRQVYEDGIRWEAGGRSLCCVNHPHFIERSRRIAGALGRHFAGNPHVIGFQLDNELGMFGARCHCPHCTAQFRDWLRAKHGTIAALNARLGMIFGSNTFSDWDDIPMPRRRQDMHNPGLLLESQRFFAESNARYLRVQADALRDAGVTAPITTNVCHMFHDGDGLDSLALFESLDLVGWDCYPVQFGRNPPPAKLGLLHAIARGFKQKPYWMLEQQSGSPMEQPADDPARIRLWTWQSIAHGASLILYFRWRTCWFGAEQYWRGILDHDGEVNARYRVVAQTGAEIKQHGAVLSNLRRRNDIALLLDYDCNQAIALNWRGAGLSYRDHAEAWYAGAQQLGLGVDVIYDAAHMRNYRAVITPLLLLVDDALAAQLRAYVQDGGMLIAGPLLAALNRDHVALPMRPPCHLQDVFGVERLEWSNLPATMRAPKELATQDSAAGAMAHAEIRVVPSPDQAWQGQYAAHTWQEQLEATTSQVLARFESAHVMQHGTPAVTRNSFGQGQAWYVGAMMEERFYRDLLQVALPALPRAPVQPASPASGEVVLCEDDATKVCFALNHAAEPAQFTLDRRFVDLLSGAEFEKSMTLPPHGVAVLKAIP